MQLTCLKSGRKIPTFIFFKVASPSPNNNQRRNTVAYELKHRLDDNARNKYPPDNYLYITCSKTENSNGELTIEILREVIFPGIGIFEGRRGGVLVDEFKGQSRDIVKEYTRSFKSGNDNVLDAHRYNIYIMAEGITPKAQPLDALLGKVFKGLYRDYFDYFMISAQSNDIGQPIAPTRHIFVTWVVKAWNTFPE